MLVWQCEILLSMDMHNILARDNATQYRRPLGHQLAHRGTGVVSSHHHAQ